MIAYREQVEISKNCTDAAFGYATAAMHASFEATNRMVDAWSAMASLAAPQSASDVHEWSGAPRCALSARLETPAAPQLPDMFAVVAAFWGLAQPNPRPGALPDIPPMMMWWNWIPQSTVPAAWPWAYGLMNIGVPKSVAWPMAEANAAMTEAVTRTHQATQSQFPAHFPAYRSDGGFATAQIWHDTAVRALTGVPAGAAALWPWLNLNAA